MARRKTKPVGKFEDARYDASQMRLVSGTALFGYATLAMLAAAGLALGDVITDDTAVLVALSAAGLGIVVWLVLSILSFAWAVVVTTVRPLALASIIGAVGYVAYLLSVTPK